MPRTRNAITAPVVVSPRIIPPYAMPARHQDARAELASEYFADLRDAWLAKGRAVLDTVAMLYPDTFLRVVASHMPREMHATVVNLKLDRLTNAELDAIVAEG